jgi:hypothetical protein
VIETATEAARCRSCGAEIEGRKDKLYCSDACRKRAARQNEEIPDTAAADRLAVTEPVTEPGRTQRTNADGSMVFEDAVCAKHGLHYLRTYVRRLDVWTGQCDECKERDRFERQAQELLSQRADKIRAKVAGMLPEYEAQVLEQAETETQAWIVKYMEEVKPQILADVRARLWGELQSQIEAEELNKIIAGLKAGKGA